MMSVCCCCRQVGKSSEQEASVNPVAFNSSVQSVASCSSPTAQSQLSDFSATTSAPEPAAPTELTLLHTAAVTGNISMLERLLTSTYVNQVDIVDKFGRTALIYAVLSDQLKCIELLVQSGSDVNVQDALGRTALHWAAHKGHANCVKLLLSRGANWKDKDSDGQTALHLSTRRKLAKCLSLLLKYVPPGAVDDQDNNKRTALHTAAAFGNLDQLRLLIKQDSNVGIPDIEGKTALHWAASCKDEQAVDCVQLILDTASSVVNWQDYEGCTALHLAVADGNEAVVSALVAVESCNVNALDNMFRTPLHWAAVLGHTRIVQLLLDSRADSSGSDSNGATPLHYAALNNFPETVKVFLSHCAVKDEGDGDGRTAFMWAAASGADAAMQCFIEHGIDLLQTDKTGCTALHAAAAAGHLTTVNMLLANAGKSDLVTATDLSKRTALSRACETGKVGVVDALIAVGADVINDQDVDGLSLLHWAAVGGHAHICKRLLDQGVDVDVRDLAGRSALLCAAFRGNVNCMSVLLDRKADCNVQDREGVTALHWACSKGHLDAVKLLVQHDAVINNMEFTEDRYTPLDYALMAEHFQIAQYMIEQGAVSITGIQDVAALKIQAWFRGYRVRKMFLERKKLLMKHEQLRKDAAARKTKTDEPGSIGLTAADSH